MQISLDSIHALGHALDGWRFWAVLVTFLATVPITAYKAYAWIKDIREKDLLEVKTSLITVTQKIEETSAAQLKETAFQTQSIVRELSELRGLLYGAFHTQPIAMAPARKKPAPRKRNTVVAELVLDNEQ